MNRKADDILRQVLTPEYEPGELLNSRILEQVKETKRMKHRKWTSAAAVAAVIMASSVTVFAAYHFLSPAVVAEKTGDEQLSDNFSQIRETEADQIQTQTYGGYEVSFLGILSGKDLSQFEHRTNGELRSDRTYAVVAIGREDGEQVQDGVEEFFVTPLIGNLNPSSYNAVTLNGGYRQFVENGILYRIMECDNVEYFADRRLYLAVMEGNFYEAEGYVWNEDSGEIERNEEYTGLNALFALPIDESKADSEKAKELLDVMATGGEDSAPELPEDMEAMIEWVDTLTPESLEQACVRMEKTVQTVTPDGEGWYAFDSWLVNEEVSDSRGGSGQEGYVQFLFEDGKPGMRIGGFSGGDMTEMVITTYTLNEDGTLTFAAYVPKEVSIYLD